MIVLKKVWAFYCYRAEKFNPNSNLLNSFRKSKFREGFTSKDIIPKTQDDILKMNLLIEKSQS